MNRLRITVGLLSTALALTACGDDTPKMSSRQSLGAKDKAAAAAAKGAAGSATDGALATLEYRDEAFVEAESNRDPFREYLTLFKNVQIQQGQRVVIMPTTSMDQMRLIAIVSGVARPRAMLVDGKGMGWTVERGDYIGRPEIVQTGGDEGVPVSLNWRVDRIRPAELVLTREDPTSPNRPSLTRIIPLYDASEIAATSVQEEAE